MDEADDAASTCERVFADTLQGQRLVSNRSVWRNFPNAPQRALVACGNVVLIGDALRTAHFSIGSGTRLAMEDAIALNKALQRNLPIEKALAAFEAARRPIVEKLVAAADASGAWYERFPEHMKLAPRDFAWSYIQRSGRIDPARLRENLPQIRRWLKKQLLFPTTLVGSYPQPEWLIDRKKLAGRFPPRVRARELWRVAEPYLAGGAGRRDLLAIRAQEEAGPRHHHRRRDPARELLQPLRHRARGRGHRQSGHARSTARAIRIRCRASSARSGASIRSKWTICCS